ncbi:MAG: aminotransferase class III-fold pyridoxal phosphate-dependent enzyme [Ignavibacteriaceae bacterium]|nr:aminotransferase class III-fold pyridoxal phosphate-dependent enzyme [Ignavibacterium sp.]MCC6255382.1 aminotransferase class III-fold pyridoxal phosphate-dependent enzyme [Ignavibacteriaceae bacterium]HRN25144.1 aminotransferase class III-fold pyridoxal phosphate-dependent enzyme [Ignavibacteriaceae bacterium]HRQ54112.1 aminotransferase class III-fold pyridoxal phosphate-dependent enzyme [Ignavibacteriaceae bacterium]
MPNKVESNKDYPIIKKSDEYYKVALDLIPCTTQTLAKGPQQNVKGVAPKYLQSGKGSHVWDVDGNEYIDYLMGIGPLSLGYAYDKVDNAIKEQLKDGITFSLMHPLEVEVAELIHKVVPNAESIRYSKTGADVTSAAVRLARAFTKRDKVLCCGYHGWHDWYISVTDRNQGIPQSIQDMTYTFNYNDIQSVIDSIDDDIACVILEPYVFEEPKDNFLQKLRDACTKNGTILIFDEMWSGFRISLGGAQEYFKVNADLACFSKAVANGMPISILTGRKDVMSLLEHDVFFFTTFGGEALSLAAATATINEMIEKDVPAQLAKQGNKLKVGYNKIAEKLGMSYTKCSGFDCRTIITFDASAGNPLEMKSLVQQEMIKRGILWGGFHNLSFSHSDGDIEYTLKTYNEVLPILKKAVDENNVKGSLRGEPVGPVFRKVSNFNMKPKKK